jgi:dTDP-4-amino-4,6-dideoxygalactose transaminase
MTTGEGGAITTDDANWAATARRMRNHGLEGRRDHVLLGYNYRMPEIAAALGLVQLAKLEELNRRRHERSRYLMEKLHPLSWAIGPRVPEHVEHTFFWCHYLIEEEELGFSTQELIERLARRGVEVRHRYRRPLYRQPLLNRFRHTLFRPDLPPYGDLHLPVAERVAGRIIGLPNRPDMSRAELDRVVDVLLHIRD